MPRTKLNDRTLPTYTRGEEIFNMTSHIVGAALSVIMGTLCIIFSAMHNNIYGIVGSSIYCFSMIFLFTMSSIYHGLKPKRKSKKVLQVMDHCSIYVLIAGTYTPILLSGMMRVSPATAWWLFGIIWAVAILGIVLNSIDLKEFKVFSMICYLVMGWCVIFKVNMLIEAIGINGFLLIMIGGIVYTIGAILYGLGKKKKYVHSIFHLCVDIAAILQFFAIILYVV